MEPLNLERETELTNPQEGLKFFRGFFIGVGLSILLWAAIIAAALYFF